MNYKTLILAGLGALGVYTVPPTYARERQASPEAITQTLDYAAFLGERILEVREIQKKYVVQSGTVGSNKLKRAIFQVKDLTADLNELKFATIDVEESHPEGPLGELLAKQRAKREAAEERALDARRVRTPFPVAYTPMTCAESSDYDQRLTEINQEYNAGRISFLRGVAGESDLTSKMEDQLSGLIAETSGLVKKFNLENNCGVK